MRWRITVSEIASVVIGFVKCWLLNKYITDGGLLSTCMPTIRSHLEITALPHTNKSFSIPRRPCFLRVLLFSPPFITSVQRTGSWHHMDISSGWGTLISVYVTTWCHWEWCATATRTSGGTTALLLWEYILRFNCGHKNDVYTMFRRWLIIDCGLQLKPFQDWLCI